MTVLFLPISRYVGEGRGVRLRLSHEPSRSRRSAVLILALQHTQFIRTRAMGRVDGHQTANPADMGWCCVCCEALLHKICSTSDSGTNDSSPYGQGTFFSPSDDIPMLRATKIQPAQRNGLEVSLGMLPPEHPFLDPRQLEAEATGLLDRMLGVLQDNSRYDAYLLGDLSANMRLTLAMYTVVMPS